MFFTGDSKAPLLALRLTSLVIMVALFTMHLRSLRVYRWEHSVTGGIIVAYFIATIGLTLCAGVSRCGGAAFQCLLQAYLSGTGAALMAVNAAAIWRRWKRAGDLTRVVAELLAALGVQLRRQVRIKVFLSAAASISLLLDLIFTPFLLPQSSGSHNKKQSAYVAENNFESKIKANL